MIIDILFILIGLVVLVFSAEILVRGAVSISSKLGISALVIGLTVVSFGTSAPELTVNISSALKGSPDLAIGNIIGSNIANILLILGVCSLIKPLAVRSTTVWREIPIALASICLLFVMGNDMLFGNSSTNVITRVDGIILMILMVLFIIYVIRMARREKSINAEVEKDDDLVKQYSALASSALIVAGLGGLVIGGQMLVGSAVDIANQAGLSEALIGITILGIGTSLPELATSVVATRRGQVDIAIGNVVGSNIFNVLWIIGLTATILQLPFNSIASVDALVAVGATLLLFIFMFTWKKHQLNRIEGAIFILLYLFYLIFLINRG